MSNTDRSAAQLERIQAMEQLLDNACAALAQLDRALCAYESGLADLRRLYDYYTSDAWQADYDDDAAGRLPAGLKRGVLSQDAVYDVMSDQQRLLETMRRLAPPEE